MQWIPLKLDMLPAITIETDKTITLYHEIIRHVRQGAMHLLPKLQQLSIEVPIQIQKRIEKLDSFYDRYCHDPRIHMFHKIKLQLKKTLTAIECLGNPPDTKQYEPEVVAYRQHAKSDSSPVFQQIENPNSQLVSKTSGAHLKRASPSAAALSQVTTEPVKNIKPIPLVSQQQHRPKSPSAGFNKKVPIVNTRNSTKTETITQNDNVPIAPLKASKQTSRQTVSKDTNIPQRPVTNGEKVTNLQKEVRSQDTQKQITAQRLRKVQLGKIQQRRAGEKIVKGTKKDSITQPEQKSVDKPEDIVFTIKMSKEEYLEFLSVKGHRK